MDESSLCNVSECASSELMRDENRMELLADIESGEDYECGNESGEDDWMKENEECREDL